MDYMNQNIALNLKRIRKARGYSLDLVAEQTGVSKSMLGQIERGEANPTVTILGKIVSGLRIELLDLVDPPKEQNYLLRKDLLFPTKDKEGKYRVYTYFPYEKRRNFEIYVMEIEPGGCYPSGAHGENTQEYLIVETGELYLKTDDTSCQVRAGDALRFDTDKDHMYYNRGDELLRFVCIFAYRN